ncbi:MAG: cysteine synthase A [Thermodesulfobacteriota bacteirum]|jgi:cysteine synthase|nr:cysteine synthase A [Thermodesulfobacteriota bacterium]
MKVYNNILETIGNTPIIKLSNLYDNQNVEIYGKLESLNPAGSIKDRICLKMIEDAEDKGLIEPTITTIIEPTSGNTGIGLALICATKGYKLILTMPEDMSEERRKMLSAYGAEVVLTPKDNQMEGAIQKCNKLLGTIKNSFSPRQFDNLSNPEAHKKTTAKEIIAQMGTNINSFVAGVGTGGTISGVGSSLKDKFPDIKIIAVEPYECPTLSSGKSSPHLIQGIGAGFIPQTLDKNSYDEVLKIKGNEAIEMTKKLATNYGLFVGVSAGANVLASIIIAKRLNKGDKVVTILCDTGERYLSTGIFS